MIVLDASAVIELLRRSSAGRLVAERLGAEDVLHVPHLLDIEVLQGLRRLVRIGQLAPTRAGEAVVDLVDLAAIRHDHERLLPRVWALRDNLTAYDAVYVALAEALDAPLMTMDRGLAEAPGHGARVQLL